MTSDVGQRSHAGPAGSATLDRVAGLRWRQPRQAAELAQQVLGEAAERGEPAVWLQAAGWLLCGRSAVGDARDVALDLLDDIDTGAGRDVLRRPEAQRLRVELAALAQANGDPDIARDLLDGWQPAGPDAGTERDELELDRLAVLVRCALVDGSDELTDLRAQVEGISPRLDGEPAALAELLLGSVHRDDGEPAAAAERALRGLARLGWTPADPASPPSSSHLGCALLSQWATALLEDGTAADIPDGVKQLTVVDGGRHGVLWRLAVARAFAGRARPTADVLEDAASAAAAVDAPSLEAACRTAQAELYEGAGRYPEALTAVRAAIESERTDRERAERLREALAGPAAALVAAVQDEGDERGPVDAEALTGPDIVAGSVGPLPDGPLSGASGAEGLLQAGSSVGSSGAAAVEARPGEPDRGGDDPADRADVAGPAMATLDLQLDVPDSAAADPGGRGGVEADHPERGRSESARTEASSAVSAGAGSAVDGPAGTGPQSTGSAYIESADPEFADPEFAGTEFASSSPVGIELAGAELAGTESAGAELAGTESAGAGFVGAASAGIEPAGATAPGELDAAPAPVADGTWQLPGSRGAGAESGEGSPLADALLEEFRASLQASLRGLTRSALPDESAAPAPIGDDDAADHSPEPDRPAPENGAVPPAADLTIVLDLVGGDGGAVRHSDAGDVADDLAARAARLVPSGAEVRRPGESDSRAGAGGQVEVSLPDVEGVAARLWARSLVGHLASRIVRRNLPDGTVLRARVHGSGGPIGEAEERVLDGPVARPSPPPRPVAAADTAPAVPRENDAGDAGSPDATLSRLDIRPGSGGRRRAPEDAAGRQTPRSRRADGDAAVVDGGSAEPVNGVAAQGGPDGEHPSPGARTGSSRRERSPDADQPVSEGRRARRRRAEFGEQPSTGSADQTSSRVNGHGAGTTESVVGGAGDRPPDTADTSVPDGAPRNGHGPAVNGRPFGATVLGTGPAGQHDADAVSDRQADHATSGAAAVDDDASAEQSPATEVRPDRSPDPLDMSVPVEQVAPDTSSRDLPGHADPMGTADTTVGDAVDGRDAPGEYGASRPGSDRSAPHGSGDEDGGSDGGGSQNNGSLGDGSQSNEPDGGGLGTGGSTSDGSGRHGSTGSTSARHRPARHGADASAGDRDGSAGVGSARPGPGGDDAEQGGPVAGGSSKHRAADAGGVAADGSDHLGGAETGLTPEGVTGDGVDRTDSAADDAAGGAGRGGAADGAGHGKTAGTGHGESAGAGRGDAAAGAGRDAAGVGHDDPGDAERDDTAGVGHDETGGAGPEDTTGAGLDETGGAGPDDTAGVGHDETGGAGPDDTTGAGPDDTTGSGDGATEPRTERTTGASPSRRDRRSRAERRSSRSGRRRDVPATGADPTAIPDDLGLGDLLAGALAAFRESDA